MADLGVHKHSCVGRKSATTPHSSESFRFIEQRMPNFKAEKLRVNLRLCINRLKLLEKKKSESHSLSLSLCACVNYSHLLEGYVE